MHKVFFHVTLVCFFPTLAVADIFSINPRATFIRTNQDSSYNTTPLALADLSLIPGDIIRLQQLGDYRPGTLGSHLDTSTGMIAVFSSSNTLLASNQLNRVPDAIDAGTDYPTSLTYRGQVTTDIPEDFSVDDTYVQIPEGAAYIFISAADSLYYDNTDPDGDFSVSISHCTCPIGDINSDCFVNLSDFSILTSQWLNTSANNPADIYPHPEGDGLVNLLDLNLLAQNWLAAPVCE